MKRQQVVAQSRARNTISMFVSTHTHTGTRTLAHMHTRTRTHTHTLARTISSFIPRWRWMGGYVGQRGLGFRVYAQRSPMRETVGRWERISKLQKSLPFVGTHWGTRRIEARPCHWCECNVGGICAHVFKFFHTSYSLFLLLVVLLVLLLLLW